MKRSPDGPARVDVLLADNRFTPERLLEDADPRRMLANFRQAVWRCGGRSGTGWLYASVHGEYQIDTGLIDLHFHLLAQGSCLHALDALRTRRGYSHPRAIRISREPLTHLPAPLTYLRQSWSPGRDRRLKRPHRGRMPEPAHSLFLLWQHQFALGELELKMGLRVIGGRLVAR